MPVSPTLDGGAQLGSRPPLLTVQPPRLGCSLARIRSPSARPRRLAKSLLPAFTAAWRSSCLLRLDSYWRGSCRHACSCRRRHEPRPPCCELFLGRGPVVASAPGAAAPRIAVSKQTGRRTRRPPQANGSGRFQICSFRRSRRHCRICQWIQLGALAQVRGPVALCVVGLSHAHRWSSRNALSGPPQA
jgi:hypothetical protein